MWLVPSTCSPMMRAARGAVVGAQRAHEALVLRVGGPQHRGGVRDHLDQRGHLALRRGLGRDQPRASGDLGERHVEAHVALAERGVVVELAVHLARERVERGSARVVGAFGREHGHADLDGHPAVAHLMPLAQELLGGLLGRGLGVGDERPSAPAARRLQVAGLAEGEQRLAQGRARDAQAAAELTLGRQAGAGGQQAELDRRAEAFNRLLERGLRADRREDRRR